MRYFLLCSTIIALSGCAETGQLAGAIVSFPIKVVSRAAGGGSSNFNDAGTPITEIPDIAEATPLHSAP